MRLDHKKIEGDGGSNPPPPTIYFAIHYILPKTISSNAIGYRTGVILQTSSGGYAEGVTPVPIPNTEVKPLRADDTARVAAWESRSLPD